MADRRRANFRMRSIGSLPLKTQRRIPADDIADGVWRIASNLGIRMTTRALTGRRVKNVEAQGEHRGERRDRGGERKRTSECKASFEMRRSKKRRGWRKMLRSQRGHTVDDILFLALKRPSAASTSSPGLLSPVDAVLAAPP